ncbi:hypothetical protein ACFPYN_13545 [Paenisporosarcina macmurdoensis]|uniref:Uncharacterized protein n=1 Tax=Paenisporosarcina macmurdoensis TaxID=212659 RepID=A0ABW1LAX7_9BACL
MIRKRKKMLLITASTVGGILLVCWLTGLMGLWIDGMRYVVGNTDKYSYEEGHMVDGEYSVDIDLSDLQSNIGKEVYNDGTHNIYVSWVHVDSVNSGGYNIGFRSSGHYSLTGASLISGNHHTFINESSFSSEVTAKMTSNYNGEIYDNSLYSSSGINFKDGDEFGFYLFPNSPYDTNEISLDEKGVVEVTVTNLYKNMWSKK